MPVDFQIKNAKVVPRGALVMLMHASEIPDGNHWQKVIAKEAIKTLGAQDYCGVIHWIGAEQWLWNPNLCRVGDNRDQMLALFDRMTPGDMPQFEPAFVKAQTEFAALAGRGGQAHDRHQRRRPLAADGGDASAALKALRVTVSTVAVGRPRAGRKPKPATTSPSRPAASFTRSTIPRPCRGFISARPAASPAR